MKLTLLVALLIATLTIQAQVQKAAPLKKTTVVQKTKLYTDKANGFSIAYPTEWTIRIPDSTENAKLFVRSPKEGDDDPFIENINFIIKPMSGNFVIEDLSGAMKSILEKQVSNFNIIEEKFVTIKGIKAYQIEYTGTKKMDEVEMDLLLIQRILIKNSKVFTLTYASQKNSNKNFYNQAIAIMNSIKVLPAK
jgi:hypothetical protein